MHQLSNPKLRRGLTMASSLVWMTLLPAASAFAAAGPTVTPGSVTLTGSSVTSTVRGTVAFRASASDPHGTAEYQFWVETPAGVWRDAQNYSPDPAFTLSTPSAGDYLVAVDVLNQAQVAAGDWSQVQTTLPDAVFVNSSVGVTSSAPPAGVPVGQAVTLTAQAQNITQPLYQFWVESPRGQWTQSGAYQSRPTFTFPVTEEGAYHYVAYAKSPLAANDSHGALQSAVGAVTAVGAAAQVMLSATSPTLVANGSARDTLVATVEDAAGDPVTTFDGMVTVLEVNPQGHGGLFTTSSGAATSARVAIVSGRGQIDLTAPAPDANHVYDLTADHLLSAASGAGGSAGQAQVANITYGTTPVLTVSPTDNQLALTSTLPNLESNAVSSTTVWVTLEDSTGAPYTTGNPQPVQLTLSGTAAGSFSATRPETTEVVTVAPGTRQVAVSVYSTPGVNGTLTVTAASQDPKVVPLQAATLSLPVVEVGAPAAIALTDVGHTLWDGRAATVYQADVVDAAGATIALQSGVPLTGTFAIANNARAVNPDAVLVDQATQDTVTGWAMTGARTSGSALLSVPFANGAADFAVATVQAGNGTPLTLTATDTTAQPALSGTTLWTFAAPAPGYAVIAPAVNAAVYRDAATGYNVTAGHTVTVSAQLTTQYGTPVALAGQPIWFQIAEGPGAQAALPNGASRSGDRYQALTDAAGIATITVSVPAQAVSNTFFMLTAWGSQDLNAGAPPAAIAGAMTTPTFWVTPVASLATSVTLQTGAATARIGGHRLVGWQWPGTDRFVGGTIVAGLTVHADNSLGASVVGQDGGLWAQRGGDSLLVTSSNPAVASFSAGYGYRGTLSPVGSDGNAWVIAPDEWSAAAGARLPHLQLNRAGTATLTITDLSNPTAASTRITITVVAGPATDTPGIWYDGAPVSAANPVPVSGRVALTVVNEDAGGNPVPVAGSEPLAVDLPSFSAASGLQWSNAAGMSAASGMTVTIPAGQSSATIWLVSDRSSGTWTGNTPAGAFALDQSAAVVQATHTLYVSPSGSNSNDGSASAPYLTIGAAVAAAPAGDTIVVEPGSYDVTTPITIGEPLTITSATGHAATGRAVISGAGPIFQLSNPEDPSAGVDEVTIAGLTFTHITNQNANGVITIGGDGAGQVRILHNVFDDLATEAIGYHGNAGLTAPLGTGFVIRGNTIDNVGGSDQSGIWLGNLRDSAVVDNTVAGTTWAGIIDTGTSQGDTQDVTIADNHVSDVPHEGIQVAYGEHIAILNNTVTAAGQDGYSNPAASMDAAISLFNSAENHLWVEGNTLDGNYQGIELGQASAPSSLGAVGANIHIGRNNLVGDVQAVVNNSTAGTLNAVDNWWGTAAGPASTQVVGAVAYTPWLTHPAS